MSSHDNLVRAPTSSSGPFLQGLVKLADFGVAAKLGELDERKDDLKASVVGTPYWMAPEVGGVGGKARVSTGLQTGWMAISAKAHRTERLGARACCHRRRQRWISGMG